MSKWIAIFLDWSGPFSRDEASQQAQAWQMVEGLYLAVGRMPGPTRQPARPLYLGRASADLAARLSPPHPRLDRIVDPCSIWLGRASARGVSGQVPGKPITILRQAQLAHLLCMPLDLSPPDNKKLPGQPFTVLNRWWKRDGQTRRTTPPHATWPVILDYGG